MNEFDKIFLSYKKILNKFKMLNIKTKNGKEITHKDLRYAVYVMLKKHTTCRWRSEKILSRRYYILDEGYKWLRYVYFQNEKKQIDADVEFFENRIKQYEELLKVKHNENWWNEDMTIKQLEEYFNRSNSSIKKAIRKCVIVVFMIINILIIIKLLFLVKVLNGYAKIFLNRSI